MDDNLIRINTSEDTEVDILTRLPLGTGHADGGVSEEFLQELLFQYPRSIPISAIDPTYDGLVPICKELNTPSGYVDALYVNPFGRIVLVEFKLWRNPQSRREVIGQILDYAKDLAGWDYEDLQRVVSLNTGRTGNVLYDMVSENSPNLNETEFVDNTVMFQIDFMFIHVYWHAPK